MSTKPFSKYFDHTNLKADATKADIEKLCKEAIENDFYSVCVNSCNVKLAKELLAGTDVKVACVVGFPLGAMSSLAKAFEAANAVSNGADEIDMVINIGDAVSGDYKAVVADVRAVAKATHKGGALLKAILETCLIDDSKLHLVCRAALAGNADCLKTSTGFSTGGATEHHVRIMKKECERYEIETGRDAFVKASGGIRDYATAMAMIEAGAERLGTSATVEIVKGAE